MSCLAPAGFVVQDRGMIFDATKHDEIRLIGIRHGESEANAARCYSGQVDAALTARGVEQAQALGERFRGVPFDAMYCSNLSRAQKTAEAIAAHHGIEPHADPILRERDYGDMENRPFDEARERFPEFFERLRVFDTSCPIPGGESADDVRVRVSSFVDRMLAEHLGQTVVLVAHGGILRTLFWHLMDVPFRVVRHSCCGNTSVSSFLLRGSWTLEFWNDTAHLPS